MTPCEGLACLRKADLAPGVGRGVGLVGRFVGGGGVGLGAAVVGGAIGREARGPVGGADAVAAVDLLSAIEVLGVFEVAAGSALVVDGDDAADVARAARGDLGASPRSRCSMRATPLALPRSRSRFAGVVGPLASFVVAVGDFESLGAALSV